MDAARRGKWIGFLCLGVTAFGWALNWPLMKLLLQQWPPLFARGLAGVAAALILFSIAKARRDLRGPDSGRAARPARGDGDGADAWRRDAGVAEGVAWVAELVRLNSRGRCCAFWCPLEFRLGGSP